MPSTTQRGLVPQAGLTSSRVDLTTSEAIVAHRLDSSIPHYKSVDRMVRLEWLEKTIAAINAIRHQRVDSGDIPTVEALSMDADVLDSYIMDDIYISDFTFQEIQSAFRMGLVGSYGEFYGINAPSLFGFLQGYWKSPKKQEATGRIRDARLKAKRDAYEREEREKARMQNWGMPYKTFDETTINSAVKELLEKRQVDDEHRARVRAQAAEILSQAKQ